VAPLIDGAQLGGLIADKVLDSDAVIAEMNARGAKIILSQYLRHPKPRVEV
jgi:hypothetical protein